jgi:hypothetical protein
MTTLLLKMPLTIRVDEPWKLMLIGHPCVIASPTPSSLSSGTGDVQVFVVDSWPWDTLDCRRSTRREQDVVLARRYTIQAVSRDIDARGM